MFLRDLIHTKVLIKVTSEAEWQSYREFCHTFLDREIYEFRNSYEHWNSKFPFKYFEINKFGKCVAGGWKGEDEHFKGIEAVSVAEAWDRAENDIKTIKDGTLLISRDEEILIAKGVYTVNGSGLKMISFEGVDTLGYIYSYRLFGEEK